MSSNMFVRLRLWSVLFERAAWIHRNNAGACAGRLFRPPNGAGRLAAISRRTLSILLWSGSLAFAWTTVRDAWDARLLVPFWDEWDFLTVHRHITESGDLFTDLWTPFNGHYEPIPRLLFLGRDVLLGGDPIALIVMCLALQAALIGIIVATLLRAPALQGSLLQHVLVASSIVLLTWTVQMENFNWSVQITFVLPAFLAVASIATVSWFAPARRIDWPIVAATVMALAACLSLGAGLAIWPAVFVIARRQRRGAQAIIITAAGAAVSIVPHWFSVEPTVTPMMVLARPLETLLFVCRYLPPLYIRDDIRVVFGALLIGLGVMAIAHASWRRGGGRLGDLAVGLVTFGLSVAFLTAIARADSGVPASSRYMAFSSLYWVGLLMFGGSVFTAREWRVARWAIYVVLLCGLEPVMTIQAAATDPFVKRADQATAAVLSMVVGTPDEHAITSHLHPNSQVPIRLLAFLREQHYGFFGNRLTRAIGHPARNMFSPAPEKCEASVDLEPRGNGLYVSGHYKAPGGPRWLVIAGPAGNVRGLAIREQRGDRIMGYAPTLRSGTLFGVEGDTLCLAGLVEGVAVPTLPASLPMVNTKAAKSIDGHEE
jgi:hypothetical protein